MCCSGLKLKTEENAAPAQVYDHILCPRLTEHGGLLEKFVAGLKSHLLQRRGVGADGMPVQRLVHALEAHVVGHQR